MFQYIMEYDRIPILLKRYSFESKMNICQKNSRKCMKKFNYDTRRKDYIFPWELEIFALMSIMRDNEYENKAFNIQGDRKFNDIIYSIKNYNHPALKGVNSNDEFIIKFLIATALTQLKSQEERIFNLFRYNFIFTFKNDKIDMNKVFENKFGCKYIEFISLDSFFFTLLQPENNNSYFKELNKIIIEFSFQLQHLQSTREHFIEIQKQQRGFLIDDPSSYYYAFKYFYHFPFINYRDTLFFPLPHLLTNAITSSLLYRLTEGDNSLRDTIGKEVLENYLFTIFKQSNIYNEVEKEVEYSVGNNPRRSPDVMLYKDEICVLFDCKMSVPSIELLRFDKEKLNDTINRCAESIKKTYERILEFGEHYEPFKYKNDFEQENIFGVVVWLEDNYILRGEIYNKVADILGLDYNSDAMNYIKSNVKFVGMRDVEKCIFFSQNYIDGLVRQRDDSGMWYDYDVGQKALKEGEFYDYNEYIKKFQEKIIDFSEKIFEKIFPQKNKYN